MSNALYLIPDRELLTTVAAFQSGRFSGGSAWSTRASRFRSFAVCMNSFVLTLLIDAS